MTLDELQTEMRDGFKKVEERFKENGERFSKIDDRFSKIDHRLETIEAELLNVRAEIKSEGESTRRHFDMMVEKMADSVKIVAEGTAHHSLRLDNHETRLKRLEKRSRQ
jgi:septation ring formation regulator EzrA